MCYAGVSRGGRDLHVNSSNIMPRSPSPVCNSEGRGPMVAGYRMPITAGRIPNIMPMLCATRGYTHIPDVAGYLVIIRFRSERNSKARQKSYHTCTTEESPESIGKLLPSRYS